MSRQPLDLPRLLAGAALLCAFGAFATLAQAPVATTPFENAKYRYSVALPAGCRHDVGPGTIDAVCSPDLDPEKSAQADSAGSLVLELSAESVAADDGKSGAALAQGYGEPQFKEELPEAVCGEPDRARVKIENAKQVIEDAQVMYTADVSCPEIKFLGLGDRHGRVLYMITPGVRYRLLARAPAEEFEERKQPIETFFSSFHVLPTAKSNP